MLTKKELTRLYVTLGKSSEEIGESIGVTGRTVRNWLKKNGMESEMRHRRQNTGKGKVPANFGVFKVSPKLGRRYVHRQGKCQPYARWLVENSLGKKLNGRKEIVHHIDENPLNDILNNLAVVTPGEHLSIHKPWLHKLSKRD